MSRSVLVDTTLCIGCRGCQVSCKRENVLAAENTHLCAEKGGYQNPPALSSQTFTLVSFTEVEDKDSCKWVFAKRQCMHCEEPACASACLVGALQRTPEGAVVYDESRCIGCRYCMLACPFGVPTFEWSKLVPYVRKCSFCFDRQMSAEAPTELNGEALPKETVERLASGFRRPACTRACPTGALKFGDREELIAEGHARIAASPGRYVNRIYGETEAGGTGWLYMSAVPFADLGFPVDLGDRSMPSYARAAKDAVPPIILGVGALLGGFYWFSRRRTRLEKEKEAAS